MALGNINNRMEQKRIYLSINKGKVVVTGAESQTYSYVDGYLESIYKKSRTFNKEVVEKWYIDLRDGEDLYSLCLPYSSGVFKSIVLALASDETLSSSTPVRIEPYKGKNGFTKVVVYTEGVKLDWITKELPQQEVILVGGKQVKDDSKQMELIESLINAITERLEKNKER